METKKIQTMLVLVGLFLSMYLVVADSNDDCGYFGMMGYSDGAYSMHGYGLNSLLFTVILILIIVSLFLIIKNQLKQSRTKKR
ncbi:MAG: putative membrane protein [Patescibacteria group bacterium]|jgi:uncharacterized membrane protein